MYLFKGIYYALEFRLKTLFSAVGFSFLLTTPYKPVYLFFDRISHIDASKVDWFSVRIAFLAAMTVVSIDFIFL